MRLCPGGGGGGLFLDRVELPPGVSEEGGPDGGGAGGAIHKTHEVMKPTKKINKFKKKQVKERIMRRQVNASKTILFEHINTHRSVWTGTFIF